MASQAKGKSPSSTPVPSTEHANTGEEANISDEEWDAMSKVLTTIYDYRAEDNYDPSKLFHRKVNKRSIPEYYETIKEPVALSTIKQKVNTKAYTSFSEFVRDFALIPHNAQVFNRSESQAYQDALVIKEQLEKELQLLVKDGTITAELATLPYLGEIPTYEEAPPEEEPEQDEEEEEDSDDEGEEDEEDEADDDEAPKRKRGRPKGSKNIKRDPGEDGPPDGKRARGRPPKLLTPTEARILAVMKGIRKPKNNRSQALIKNFDRLPDKQALPDYYVEIKNPIAFDVLKKKVKRKKYKTLEEFMADVNLMFDNAKQYNQDESQIYKDATVLKKEAGRLYDIERAKSDDEFADEEGKVPMPNGILHNGELYKVGDWVHIRNPNDLTKPMPAQIYRTYKNQEGQQMVNICWYYRPEQTVHRFDKHFLPNEIVKTGRYRDHSIDDVEGKCFVMFTTRYFKGRPRGLPEGLEVYVCESRYNETLHQFNKIKTWASCLPDEVRDKDYEMDLFDHPRKIKKYPSPIAYLLKEDQKETDELPKPQWGAEGAPPKVGAVHRRPRGDRDSPPPEPTPPPPPKMPTPPARSLPPAQPAYQPSPAAMSTQTSQRPLSASVSSPAFTAAPSHSYGQTTASPAFQRPPPAPPSYTPHTPHAPLQRAPPPPPQSYQQQSSVPPNPPQYPPRPALPQSASNYRDPPPIEVYTLPDQANLSIPPEVREQYQQDANGRVLFFTAPPVAVTGAPVDRTGKAGLRGHSVRYLAEKQRRKEILEKKRAAPSDESRGHATKKVKVDGKGEAANNVAALKRRALEVFEKHMATTVAKELHESDLQYLSAAQRSAIEQKALLDANKKKRQERSNVLLGNNAFADDTDTRVS